MLKDKDELDKCLAENPSVELAMKLRSDRLTKRQIAFVLNYADDPHEAALKAGYSNPSVGVALLRNKAIVDAIIERDKAMDKLPKDHDPVMSLQQLRAWWTEQVVDDGNGMATRVKCSELLAKSFGAFIDKVVQGDQYNQINVRNQAFTVTINTTDGQGNTTTKTLPLGDAEPFTVQDQTPLIEHTDHEDQSID